MKLDEEARGRENARRRDLAWRSVARLDAVVLRRVNLRRVRTYKPLLANLTLPLGRLRFFHGTASLFTARTLLHSHYVE